MCVLRCFLRCFAFLGLLSVFMLGCKVSPPDEATTTPSVNRLELKMSSPQQSDTDSFPNSDEITITARLLDATNAPLKSELVKLVTTLGTLSSDTVLTDTSGYARAKISPSDTLGAGTITATFNTVSASVNFELFASTPVIPITTPKINLSLLRSGLAINRFKSNEVVQLQVLVTDVNNAPLVNQIVKFTAELGTIGVDTGLTNQNGVAQVNLTATNSTLGAAMATATVTINEVDLTATVNYEVLDSAINVTDQVYKLGHFDSSNAFIENRLGISVAADANGSVSMSAGATLGVSLAIVDENNQRIMTPSQVNFTSACAASQHATIGTGIFSVNGVASTTFEDLSCGGSQDVIQATVTVNNQTKTLSQIINIGPENIGSIEFISSSPESIVLKGTGGQDKQETSTLTFLVKGALGNPLAQQLVNFSLNTAVGNLTITPSSSLTNSSGLVTTKVNAGNVPTAVRVTATVSTASNQIIQTQSDLLSVNTGMADQDSFSLSPEVLNPEAQNYDGVEVMITARLADAFNNPVPDGTTINFTTEGGNIVPTCNTTNGVCSVKWISSEPRVPEHRITILATAVGHETFNDTNGSNTFDAADGVGFFNKYESGLSRVLAAASGFFDMAEAWRDDNESNVHDMGEKFIDFNNNQRFDSRDNLFNGPQCLGSLCGTGTNQSLHVRRAIVLVMAGSEARLTLMSQTLTSFSNASLAHIGNRYVYSTTDTGSGSNRVVVDNTLTIAEDESETFALSFADFGMPYGQMLPAGTTIQVTTEGGALVGETSYTVLNSIGSADPNVFNGREFSFTITNPNTLATAGDLPVNGILKIIATTPKGVITTLLFNFTLAGT